MKNASVTIWFVITAAIIAAAWFFLNSRKDWDQDRLNEEDDYAAIPELIKRAEQGDGEAQYLIGLSYLDGISGLKQDIPLGREWLQKALAQGYADAAMRLYRMDMWPNGQYYSYIYDTQGGLAAEAIYKKAAQWLEQGILVGDKESFFSIITPYNVRAYLIQHADELIPAVHAKKKALTTEAGEFRSSVTEFYYYQLLGLLYFIEKNYDNAMKYLEKASKTPYMDEFHGIVAYHLGRIYEEGLGVVRDERKAREIYATTPQRTQTKGDRMAMWHLAMMQAQGRGGEVDKASAAELLAELEKFLNHDQHFKNALQNIPGAGEMDALRKAIASP